MICLELCSRKLIFVGPNTSTLRFLSQSGRCNNSGRGRKRVLLMKSRREAY